MVAMTDPRMVLAARNNADWCDIVCHMHGIRTRFDDDLWTSNRRSPPMYPDAVTLQPLAAPDRLLDRIDTSAGCSVKDSFASLDLARARMRVLFEADWLYRPATLPSRAGRLSWRAVRTAEQLRIWATAHGGGDVFKPALLADPNVTVLVANGADDAPTCGAIANRSTGAVGVSNVFTTIPHEQTWPGLVDAISSHYPRLPVVGYEHGESRTAALAAGFVPVGELRVWLRE
jgi:hypothetical protein